jgi:hypothetical protein
LSESKFINKGVISALFGVLGTSSKEFLYVNSRIGFSKTSSILKSAKAFSSSSISIYPELSSSIA